MTAIKFGTDGWRGIIAEDFTFANARTVAEAISRYVVRGEDARKGVHCWIRPSLRIRHGSAPSGGSYFLRGNAGVAH